MKKKRPYKGERGKEMKRIVWWLDFIKLVAFMSALLVLLVSQYLLTSAFLTLSLVSLAVMLGIFIGGKTRYRGAKIILVFIEMLFFAIIIWIYRHNYLINGIGLIWIAPYLLRLWVSEHQPKKRVVTT